MAAKDGIGVMKGREDDKIPSPQVGGSRLLSLREAMVIADVAERQHFIRQDVADGVYEPLSIRHDVDSYRRYDWVSALIFAAIYGNRLLICDQVLRAHVAGRLYLAALHNLRDMDNRPCPTDVVQIDKYLAIPLGAVWRVVKPRVDLYRKGLSRIREDVAHLPEGARFRFSGVLVEEAARLGEDGEDIENILADYLYLSEDDISFARLYVRACLVMDWPYRS